MPAGNPTSFGQDNRASSTCSRAIRSSNSLLTWSRRDTINGMQAWRVHEYGAPLDVLHLDEVDAPEPADDEVKIRVTSVP